MNEQWQRVLWKRQPYPDNYITPFFLKGLRRNTNFHPYTYPPVVLASCNITQHISTIFIFIATFARLHSNALDPRLLVLVAVACYVLGYTAWEVLESRSSTTTTTTTSTAAATAAAAAAPGRGENRAKAIKSSLLVFLALIALSPVLRTLTAATSSDSIWALSACLFMLNALLADYGSSRPHNRNQERLTSVLSMNAAISASVVLASRLSTNVSVFALTLFSVQSFALFPIMRVRLQTAPPFIRVALTVILAAASLYLTIPLSRTAAYLVALLLILITFIAPGVLIWAQNYKNEIRGPWDVAVPKIR